MSNEATFVHRRENSEPEILIVDDTPANLDVLFGMLGNRGYRIRMATNGPRAIAAVHASLPDLIMLDINMPGMNGYEVCRQLKSNPATSATPVIFISALGEVIDKVKAFEAGGVDYVTKPFEFGEVLARIENQLKIARLRMQLEDRNRELERINRALLDSQRRETRMFEKFSDVLPGTVIDGRYRLEEKIASGGFGTVFRATQLNLDRPVAVKIYQSLVAAAEPLELERFQREGASACRVNHGNAVVVFDSAVSDTGIAYLVTELLEGRTLAEELQAAGVIAPSRAVQIMSTVCDVLAAAHDAAIVHRDVKPDNIFLHASAAGEIVKVLDFGIAKLLGSPSATPSSLTAKNVWVGTPFFMAPERLRGEPQDGKADVYSAGVTLYELLTGELPYADMDALLSLAARRNEDQASIRDRLREKSPTITPALEEAVFAAMVWNPAERPTMRELKELLDNVTDR